MKKMIQILEQHSIEIRVRGEKCEALARYTKNGVSGSKWVEIDLTNGTVENMPLFAWLGY